MVREDRFDRRLKWWWVAAEDQRMAPMETETMVDTQPIMLDEGFIDFDDPAWRPVDVSVPKRTPESVMRELMAALRDE